MQSQKNYKRIVVKIGSSLLYADGMKLDCRLIGSIADDISSLVKEGREVAVVSSGAIALGMGMLKLASRPKELSGLQAAAAIGQPELMDIYRVFFKERGLNCAQLLLTWDDFSSRRRYLNAKSTLSSLLKLKSIPVVNENDTVSTEEIKFGDNDRLSALVATLVSADLLLILSDVAGLLAADKKTLVPLVEKITPSVKAMATSTDKKTSVGGMVTKLEAAEVAVNAGIPCVIASGREKNIIRACVKEPGCAGTLFLPQKEFLAAKERWIAFSAKPKGKIIVDEGCRKALENKKSLLSVGVTACEGNFACGDIVSLCGREKCEFARGRARLSAKDLDKVKGKRSEKEIVHRDDIAIL